MPTYPAPVGPRRAYDADGTLVRTITGTTPSVPSSADIEELNLTAATGGIAVSTYDWLALVFPSPITIDSWYLAHGHTADLADVDVEISTDTTNGGDGTWASAGTVTAHRGDWVVSDATWRFDVTTGLAHYCKGIRFAPVTSTWQTLHLYGGGSGEDPEGLYIRSSAYEALPYGTVDWGSVPRGSSADTSIVVANTSTRTATGVTLAVEAAEATDEFAVTHYLSTDGRNFAATVALGTIAARSRSGTVTVRRVTPTTASLGARAARLVATAASWE